MNILGIQTSCSHHMPRLNCQPQETLETLPKARQRNPSKAISHIQPL